MKLYICSVSFEDRCRALPQGLPTAGGDEVVFVIDFEGYENIASYMQNRRILYKELSQKCYLTVPVRALVEAPLDALSRLEHVLREYNIDDVLLDLSTLPRKYIFGLCSLVARMRLHTTIRYYRPQRYGNELSRGIRSVEPIAGFEGDMNTLGETTLGVILGFEGYKALHAWERIGPTRVLAFLGDPPFREEFLSRSRECNRELLNETGRVTEQPLNTFEPFTAVRQLRSTYAQIKAERNQTCFVLCPLGTKLQTVAAFAFAFQNPSVSVIHVSSLNYFTGSYSTGFEGPIDLDLGALIAEGANA